MRAGHHPKTGVWLGQPRRIDPALDLFSVVLGESLQPQVAVDGPSVPEWSSPLL